MADTSSRVKKRIKSIHPFPARMAPEIALDALNKFPAGSVVLDPMAGSGTVLRQAMLCGHHALGYDLDPMAVILSRAWTAKVSSAELNDIAQKVLNRAKSASPKRISLPWIDNDPETKKFISFWFEKRQATALRRLAYAMHSMEKKISPAVHDALKTAFSRLIITKKRGASVAWDVSHSRPHKKIVNNDFDVFHEFERSVAFISKHYQGPALKQKAKIRLGDARNMNKIRAASVDVVLTSPPYLNAIDYMRGHKLALVWLGHSISQLRNIRSSSVGAERGVSKGIDQGLCKRIAAQATTVKGFAPRHIKMIERYTMDAHALMAEVRRVLKPGGIAILVIGDSCLKGNFVKNSAIFRKSAESHGLRMTKRRKRPLPMNLRYLPTPKMNVNSLAKRMREEIIMTFQG